MAQLFYSSPGEDNLQLFTEEGISVSRRRRLLMQFLPICLAIIMAFAPVFLTDNTPTSRPFAAALFLGIGIIVWTMRGVIMGRTKYDAIIFGIAYFGLLVCLRDGIHGLNTIYSPLTILAILWVALNGAFWELLVIIATLGAWHISTHLMYTVGVDTTPRTVYGFIVVALMGILTHYLTQRLRVELNRLRINEQRLETILNTASEAFLNVDTQGVLYGANMEAHEILGYEQGDLLGTNIYQTVFPQGRNNLATGADAEALATRKDGTLFPVSISWSSFRLPDGQTMYNLFVRDITERKTAEGYREVNYQITDYLSRSSEINRAMPRVLRMLAKTYSWDLVTAWMPDLEGKHWGVAGLWNQQLDDELDLEIAALTAPEFTRNPLSQPLWAANPKAIVPKIYLEKIKECRFEQTLVVPMLHNKKTVGYLCFHRTHMQEPDDQVARTLAATGSQIAQFTERVNAEARYQNLQALEINDDVVQALTMAQLYTEAGKPEMAQSQIARALEASKRIITKLARGSVPGSLVRDEHVRDDE